jgi:CheY-like chemotaxis protein
VDDEPAICALLRIAFVRAGYHVDIADNVAAAKALCKAQPFDAVLSDVVMPDGNGHELMRWIALNRPATATVLMTGFDVGCEKCPLAGRCNVIAKALSAWRGCRADGECDQHRETNLRRRNSLTDPLPHCYADHRRKRRRLRTNRRLRLIGRWRLAVSPTTEAARHST